MNYDQAIEQAIKISTVTSPAHRQPFAAIITRPDISKNDKNVEHFYFVEILMRGSAVISCLANKKELNIHEVWARPMSAYTVNASPDYRAVRLFFDRQYWAFCLHPLLVASKSVSAVPQPDELVFGPTYGSQRELTSLESYLIASDLNTLLLVRQLSHQLILRSLASMPIVPFDPVQLGETVHTPCTFSYFLEANFTQKLTVKNMADAMGKSLTEFKRFFASRYDLTPMQWLVQRRLEYAYYLLREHHYTVETSALMCGFTGTANFTQRFKKHFGIAASGLRKI